MKQQEIIEKARQAGMRLDKHNGGFVDASELLRFAKLVASAATAKEREACAKICEEQAQTNYWEGADVCAEDIQARGET